MTPPNSRGVSGETSTPETELGGFCKAIAGKIADTLIAKALKGDVRACAEIADCTEGKAPQSMHIGGDAELRVIIETIG